MEPAIRTFQESITPYRLAVQVYGLLAPDVSTDTHGTLWASVTTCKIGDLRECVGVESIRVCDPDLSKMSALCLSAAGEDAIGSYSFRLLLPLNGSYEDSSGLGIRVPMTEEQVGKDDKADSG